MPYPCMMSGRCVGLADVGYIPYINHVVRRQWTGLLRHNHPATDSDMQHHNRRQAGSSIASTTTTSASSSSTSATSHPYLGNQQIHAIESWKTCVASESPRPQGMSEQDSVIEAYLQAKMALFQSMQPAHGQTVCSQPRPGAGAMHEHREARPCM